MRKTLAVVVSLGVLAALSGPAAAAGAFGQDKNPPKNSATPELPKCDRPLGTAAVQEPENRWWVGLGLSSPEALLKLFAARSGCLRIVDRNGGLAMRNQEAALGAGGDLARGSNVGRGQVTAADFFIIPDIANSNANSGGKNIGGIAGGLLGNRLGGFGAIAGGLSTKTSEAQTLITLVDARTTEQLYVAEGVAKKTDVSFNLGGGGGGWGGFGAAAGGGYGNTDIGKVITGAYFNAFVDLVGYMQRQQPGVIQASAPIQAYTIKSAAQLRATPSPTAKLVRNFAAGDMVYPTGQKNGVWWEVDDETGNRGWVSSALITAR